MRLQAIVRSTARSIFQQTYPIDVTIWGIIALAFALLAVDHTVSSRSSIESVDFYYYILNARDLAHESPDTPLARYIYFPGVYHFWESVIRTTDGTLPSLQWAYLGVLLTNAALTGWILQLSINSWAGALLGSGLYIILANRLEGLCGCTEPIVTVPFLAGLLLWTIYEHRRQETVGALCLAIACGLCLFIKQQGGLLAVGILALGITSTSPFRLSLHRFSLMAVAAAGAGITFTALMWWDGGGYAALKAGLDFAAGYSSHGSWIDHISRIWHLLQPLSTVFLVAVLILTTGILRKDLFGNISLQNVRLLSFTILSTVAGLLQFSKRGYLHYALLILPCVILASIIGFQFLLAISRPWFAHRSFGQQIPLVLAAAALALFTMPGKDAALHDFTNMLNPPQAPNSIVHHQPELSALCSKLQPNSFLLIIPARHNEVHWECGTRTIGLPLGYGWENLQPAAYVAALNNPRVTQVLVFQSHEDEAEGELYSRLSATTITTHLLNSGFNQSVRSHNATLYQTETKPAL